MTEEQEIELRSACRYKIIDGVKDLNESLASIESELELLVHPSVDSGVLGRISTDGTSASKKQIRGILIDFTKTVGKINDSLEKLPENEFTDSEVLSHGYKGRISVHDQINFYNGTLDVSTLEKKLENNNDKITAD